jgi:hypothetical protein
MDQLQGNLKPNAHAKQRMRSGPRAGFQKIVRYSIFKERAQTCAFSCGKGGRGI